ncbi:MAG: hypothetical protein IK005_10520 [Paludibacteraceae bacterium]|nr:hypothetical protein [Paludibacteraceae bacterium]MBR4840893.1 hypothetical protein [Paludibacteraceae bacterium]
MLTYICRFISLVALLLLANPAFAGKKSKKSAGEEQKQFFYGVYLDYDLADPLMGAIDNRRFGMNSSVVLDFQHLFYPAFELGYATYDASSDYIYDNTGTGTPTENVKYEVNGTYYKVGLNINLLAKDYTKKLAPYGYVGFRYAIAPRFEYEISGYKTDASLWKADSDYIPEQKGNTKAQWGEFLAGVNTPIFKGFCMGVELRYKGFLTIKTVEEDNCSINQSYVPGYGDYEDGTWGFRYTISYFFH